MNQNHIFFEQEIIRIKEEYGTQYFSKSGFHAVLKDLSPKIERKYFTVLKFADDFGLCQKIKEIIALNVSLQTITIEHLKQQFIDDSGLDASIANEVFWAFLYGNSITAIRSSNIENFNELDSSYEDSRSSKISLENLVESIQAKKVRIEENIETIIIGDQEWMKSNLSITQFANGESIPLVKSSDEWKKRALAKQPACCYYENDEHNLNQYGLLYNWWVISDERGIAPSGYRIPSKEDFEVLKKTAQKNGKLLKSKSKWNGTDELGFSALPAGFRSKDGKFKELRDKAYFWSYTNLSENRAAYYVALWSYIAPITVAIDKMYNGFSIRLLKN